MTSATTLALMASRSDLPTRLRDLKGATGFWDRAAKPLGEHRISRLERDPCISRRPDLTFSSTYQYTADLVLPRNLASSAIRGQYPYLSKNRKGPRRQAWHPWYLTLFGQRAGGRLLFLDSLTYFLCSVGASVSVLWSLGGIEAQRAPEGVLLG